MQPQVDPLVQLSITAGEAFIKGFYYTVHDQRRSELHRFYQESSLIVWNGMPYKGVHTVTEFFKHLPPTVHSILSIDCQPVVTSVDPAVMPSPGSILVTVTGVVTFGNNPPPKPFFQSFVLYPTIDQASGQTSYYVGYDCFRVTA